MVASGRLTRIRDLSLPRWLEITLWALATIVCARLIYLPQARPLGSDDLLSAPAGQWLVLDGVAKDAAITISVPLAGDARFSAARAALDVESRTYLASIGVSVPQLEGPLRWAASGTDGEAATLVATVSAISPVNRLALASAPGGAGLRLRADGGHVGISVRIETAGTARGLLEVPGSGGSSAYGPGRPITFDLSSGQEAELGFATTQPVQLWLQGDGMDAPLAVTQAEIEAGGAILTRICGGRAGAIMVGSAFFQLRARPIPSGRLCRSGNLMISALSLGQGALTASPSGSAYVPGELAAWTTLMKNPALAGLLAAIIAYPGLRLTGLLQLKSEPAKPDKRRRTKR